MVSVTEVTNSSVLFFMKIFGMGVVVPGEGFGSKMARYYGGFVVSFHVLCTIVVQVEGDLKVNYSQNTLTRSSFWIQYYGKIFLVVFIVASVLRNRRLVHEVQEELDVLEKRCSRYGEGVHATNWFTLLVLLVTFTTAPTIMVFDMFNNPKNRDVFLAWSAYAPGTTMLVYVAYMSSLKRRASAVFRALNTYLEAFTKDLTWMEKLKLRLYTGRDAKKTMGTEHLQEFFVDHSRLYDLTVKLNRIYSFEYLTYMVLCLHAIILIIYLIVLDLIRVRTKQGIFVREHHFTEYWSVMYVLGFFTIILAAHELNESGNAASSILHSVRSIYNNLNEHASVYSFQLMYSEINTSAAGFFDLDYSTLMGVLGITIKYVFILMQFDQGVDIYMT